MFDIDFGNFKCLVTQFLHKNIPLFRERYSGFRVEHSKHSLFFCSVNKIFIFLFFIMFNALVFFLKNSFLFFSIYFYEKYKM